MDIGLEGARAVDSGDSREFFNVVGLSLLTEVTSSLSCKLEEAWGKVLMVVGVFPHLRIILLDIPAVKVLVKILFNLRKGGLRIIR